KINNTFNVTFEGPLLDTWPLFGSPVPITVILISYAFFVLYLGPNYMRNRAPFNLKYMIILYNTFQVYYNFWLISQLQMVMHKQFMKHMVRFGCVNGLTDEETKHFGDTVSLALWHATIDRVFDLFDTVFFVLNKKQSHVTFLHVYHHISVVAILWTASKYFQGLEFGIVGICNIFVHMIMYFYYLVAALGPQFRKFLWWKRYLTTLQIIQFLIILFYMLGSLWLSCNFRKNVIYVIIAETIINLVLFLHFYRKAYKKDITQVMMKKISICGSAQIDQNYDINGNYDEKLELSKKHI
ncbi:very long chain fatty acid elongase AAEL008004-like, partial [Culicoides brevitarsis]|uniref:very long chain fatty acid elongase AAEL008004-like n=1 Tax=Culicoides brevitarsis TaxID=469753 RepID=UPI00307B349F